MSLRLEFIALASLPDANLAELARRFGISRKTAHKWRKRVAEGGLDSLADHSRRPHSSPTRTPDQLENLILQLRKKHPDWGGRKLRTVLIRDGHDPVPAASTITAILRRHGQLDGPRAGQPRDWRRFEHPAPNDLWQMDFKGHFAMTDGKRCHPLTVLDDHSRYALGIVACADERTETVRNALTTLFQRYGLPRRILSDNGPPWGSDAPHPYTALTVWLLRLGVAISHGRPCHPQTQGKDERFHRTFKTEVLSRQTFSNLADSQNGFDAWREVYNQERPHEALGMSVPLERYRVSPRSWPTELPALEYDPTDLVRKVQSGGVLHYHGKTYQLAKAFYGSPVALRTTGTPGEVSVWFGIHRIGYLDEETGTVQRRSRLGE